MDECLLSIVRGYVNTGTFFRMFRRLAIDLPQQLFKENINPLDKELEWIGFEEGVDTTEYRIIDDVGNVTTSNDVNGVRYTSLHQMELSTETDGVITAKVHMPTSVTEGNGPLFRVEKDQATKTTTPLEKEPLLPPLVDRTYREKSSLLYLTIIDQYQLTVRVNTIDDIDAGAWIGITHDTNEPYSKRSWLMYGYVFSEPFEPQKIRKTVDRSGGYTAHLQFDLRNIVPGVYKVVLVNGPTEEVLSTARFHSRQLSGIDSFQDDWYVSDTVDNFKISVVNTHGTDSIISVVVDDEVTTVSDRIHITKGNQILYWGYVQVHPKSNNLGIEIRTSDCLDTVHEYHGLPPGYYEARLVTSSGEERYVRTFYSHVFKDPTFLYSRPAM